MQNGNVLSNDAGQMREDKIMGKKALSTGLGVLFGFLLIFSPFGNSLAEEPKKILSIEAYDMLNTVPDTYLIDVRTRAEYQFVGHPISAYLFPYMFMTNKFLKKNGAVGYRFNERNKRFVQEISKVFKKTDNLLIICRDGTRSAPAVKELVKAGFKKAYDVEDGFEGLKFPAFKDSNKNKFYHQLAKRYKIHGFDKRRHYGWQWWGLPWTYDIVPKFVYPPDKRSSKKKK
jgi:rhodanese-related sulfurtransferase